MIEDSLIESARIIKHNFILLTDKLSTYEKDVSELSQYFLKASEDLKKIGNNIHKEDTLITIRDRVILRLNELEEDSNRICNKIEEVNIEMEKLKREEMNLYLVIKKRYPSLSDDEIKSEIFSRIN